MSKKYVSLASPSLPVFSLLPEVWVDACVITLVGYTTALSMALIFARKLMYEVDANQELLAHGLTNFVSAFFSCLPTAASLSRCVVQEAVGGKTQMASVVSSILILIVLLWVGPLFELLPRCVLASVVLIALQGLIFQVREFPLYWRLSRWDGFVWIVTFLTTLIVHISVGLGVGIMASLLSLAVQSLSLDATVMGSFGGTDLYLATDTYKAAVEIPSIKIIHFVGCVNFTSKNSFKKLFTLKTGFNPARILRCREKLLRKRGNLSEEEQSVFKLDTRVVIFDFSSVTFMDPSGVATIRQLQFELDQLNVTICIAECTGRAYQTITECDKHEKKSSHFLMFPTVHDAVLFAQAYIVNDK